VLLSRRTKRQASVLAAVAALLLVGRWIDVYLTVMPQTLRTPAFGAAELLIAGAYAGAAAGTIAWSIARR
jgi:hypothetical protein